MTPHLAGGRFCAIHQADQDRIDAVQREHHERSLLRFVCEEHAHDGREQRRECEACSVAERYGEEIRTYLFAVVVVLGGLALASSAIWLAFATGMDWLGACLAALLIFSVWAWGPMLLVSIAALGLAGWSMLTARHAARPPRASLTRRVIDTLASLWADDPTMDRDSLFAADYAVSRSPYWGRKVAGLGLVVLAVALPVGAVALAVQYSHSAEIPAKQTIAAPTSGNFTYTPPPAGPPAYDAPVVPVPTPTPTVLPHWVCADGTWSYSTGRGTCSWHGGEDHYVS